MVSFAVRFNDGDILAGVFGEYPVEIFLNLKDLLGLNLNIGALTLAAAGGLMDHNFGIGKRKALTLAPLDSRNAPMDAAIPMHIVDTSGFIYCMVS